MFDSYAGITRIRFMGWVKDPLSRSTPSFSGLQNTGFPGICQALPPTKEKERRGPIPRCAPFLFCFRALSHRKAALLSRKMHGVGRTGRFPVMYIPGIEFPVYDFPLSFKEPEEAPFIRRQLQRSPPPQTAGVLTGEEGLPGSQWYR